MEINVREYSEKRVRASFTWENLQELISDVVLKKAGIRRGDNVSVKVHISEKREGSLQNKTGYVAEVEIVQNLGPPPSLDEIP